MAKKRQRMSRERSRKVYNRTVGKTHRLNMRGAPMRGGIRL